MRVFDKLLLAAAVFLMGGCGRTKVAPPENHKQPFVVSYDDQMRPRVVQPSRSLGSNYYTVRLFFESNLHRVTFHGSDGKTLGRTEIGPGYDLGTGSAFVHYNLRTTNDASGYTEVREWTDPDNGNLFFKEVIEWPKGTTQEIVNYFGPAGLRIPSRGSSTGK